MSEEISELDLPYRSEYAKSGRSSCKACKTSIGKAELRLAAMVQVKIKVLLFKILSHHLIIKVLVRHVNIFKLSIVTNV